MGYWGYNIWDGDGPLDYLISLVRTLSTEVDALLATKADDQADLDADVLPRLAVIDHLCTGLPAAPPSLDEVRRWRSAIVPWLETVLPSWSSEYRTARADAVNKLLDRLDERAWDWASASERGAVESLKK